MVDQQMHRAAWLYYNHGLRQEEVAAALSVSRATVVKYLRQARDSGAVSISVSSELFKQDLLARELEDAFSLEAVWIAPGDVDNVSTFPMIGATALLELVESETQIALAWGETLYSVVDALPTADFSDITILQMCGNLAGEFDYLPDQCTIEIARKLNARGQNLYAPLTLSTEELARLIRKEPVVARQLADLVNCDLAVFSVGSCTAASHIVSCGAISKKELASAVRQGAVGVIAGRLINRYGQELDCRYNHRLVSTDLSTLAKIPKRLVMVKSQEKCHGLMATLNADLASHLVVTAEVGQVMMKNLESGQ